MAKAAGLSENDLKGKSLSEQIKLITKKMNEAKDDIELESAKEYIDNYKAKIPKLVDFLRQPYEIYVKKVGQKKTPTTVKVVGYNLDDDTVIVLNGKKIYQVKDDVMIKSLDELATLKKAKTPRKGGTKKK